jgi:predicted nucleic acid-binding protein
LSAYVDSALLVKLFVRESNSEEIARLVRAYTPPLPLVELHELEIRNAIRLKAVRNEISGATLATAIADFETDIASGVFQRKPVNWAELFAQAEVLSAMHAAETSCRTLDILHVAAAKLLNVVDFVTTDHRQQRLATRVGLSVKPAGS